MLSVAYFEIIYMIWNPITDSVMENFQSGHMILAFLSIFELDFITIFSFIDIINIVIASRCGTLNILTGTEHVAKFSFLPVCRTTTLIVQKTFVIN